MSASLTSVLAAVAAALAIAGSSGASAADTDLRMRVWNAGRSNAVPTRVFTLRCGPVGGNLRSAGDACRRLAARDRPFAPLPKDAQCTQIYGGPQEALVTGRHRGQKVWVLLRLRDGCHIARWRSLAFLTPGYGTASGS